MRSAKLTPWPFGKDEEVNLYWLSSPYINRDNGEKLITAHFQTGKEYKAITFPWGTLPLLKMGYGYKNGICTDLREGFIKGILPIQKIIDRKIGRAYDLIKRCHHSLRELGHSAGFEQCISLYSNDGKKYIIPCIELVRVIFANTKFFANQLLSTSALDECTVRESIEGDSIYIDFSHDYPYELFDENHVSEYVGLKHTDLYVEWKRIYSDFVLSRKILSSLPLFGDEKIHYHSLDNGNDIIILNMRISGIRMPFRQIIATHPNYGNSDESLTNTRTRYPGSRVPNEIELEGEGESARNGKSLLIEDYSSTIRFNNSPKVELISKNKQEGYGAKTFIKPKQDDTYTMQDNLLYGKARAVEVSSKKSTSDIVEIEGFEDFCKMLKYIKCEAVKLNTGFISGASDFALLSSGTQRKYLIVDCIFTHTRNLTLIEVQTENWTLSTLVIWGSEANYQLANDLIEKLSANGGHWDTNWLKSTNSYNISKLRHFKGRYPAHWADLIMNCSN